ncbi:hypothetical protein T484DRAFT_1629030, partial [Baffinella frigidus]
FRVQGSGSGFRVQGSGSGFRVQVQGSGFRVQGSGFRVQGFGFRVSGRNPSWIISMRRLSSFDSFLSPSSSHRSCSHTLAGGGGGARQVKNL